MRRDFEPKDTLTNQLFFNLNNFEFIAMQHIYYIMKHNKLYFLLYQHF